MSPLRVSSMLLLVSILAFFAVTLGVNVPQERTVAPGAYVLHEWVTPEYDWVNEDQKQRYITELLYIPSNNAITGIKVWKDNVYVTVPRWRPGVPSTLNKVVIKNGKPILQPFPSWGWQDLVTGLKYIQSMEIDNKGWMWILDVGRLNIFGSSPEQIINGPASLVIYDLEKNCLIRKYEFPNEVVPYNASFLNDLVIDQTRGMAYMGDTWGEGGIVVYDFINNRSRYWRDTVNKTTAYNPADSPININGVAYPLQTPEDGIGLSSDASTLYYCPLASRHLYSLPVSVLVNWNLTNVEIAKHITHHGIKGYSDGLAFSDNGKLYYGSLAENSIKVWDPKTPLSSAQTVIQNITTSQWPDTFAFDGKGNLYYTSNRLELWFFNTMKYDGDANFRIWVVPINGNSYLAASQPIYDASCSSGDGDGLSTGAIVGISIGVAAFVVLLVGVIVLTVVVISCYCKQRKEESTKMSYVRLAQED